MDLILYYLQYHPDVRAGNETKFQAISEAYSILGNTDARQVYDNNLTSSSSSSYTHSSSQSASNPYYYQDIETGATRRARANYAWEHTRRTNPKYNRANPFASAYSDHQRQSAHEQFFNRMQAQQAWRQSNLSPGARRRMMEENEKIAREENLRNTSGLLRTLQVVGIFTAVLWMSGTFRASAWEADASERVHKACEDGSHAATAP
jgi:curved DNA-binding protein CbpA